MAKTNIFQATALTANDLTGLQNLGTNFFSWIANKDYQKGVLTALQAVYDDSGALTTVDSSACIIAYDVLWGDIESLSYDDVAAAKTAFQEMREAKGDIGATNMGFFIDQFGTYQQLVTSGFDFYNECNLDYYMVAIGQAAQNPTGFVNISV